MRETKTIETFIVIITIFCALMALSIIHQEVEMRDLKNTVDELETQVYFLLEPKE